MDLGFFKNKKVLITGHTGFKGTWMCAVLERYGADILGYSLNPPTNPSLFDIINMSDKIDSRIGDIRDLNNLMKTFDEFQPEIVIHMAAQPLVRESYINPVYTYDVNVMGTVNVLEAIRNTDSVKSVIIVTTDKVYKNNEWVWGYREDDELNGFDPYSNSKSCADIATDSYIKSFFRDRDIAISTVRAGNVIGGGDFAVDRIIPDCYRAALNKEPIVLRNPYSTRPYQHVLEPVCAYLLVTKEQMLNKELASTYNIGPENDNCVTTGALTDIFCEQWNKDEEYLLTKKVSETYSDSMHEASFLKLDISKIKRVLSWSPKWNIYKTMEKTVECYKAIKSGKDIYGTMLKQIDEYISEF